MSARSSRARRVVGVALVAGIVAAATTSHAHKPVTSPYTYNDDVFPILRDRCGGCHVNGGVAPMSLMTHEEALPWGESMRVELLAGHMPPWSVDADADQFQNAESLTPREMDLLLTWATGGAPFGNPDKTPKPVIRRTDWALGPPDLQLPFPMEFTLAAEKQEAIVEFAIPVDAQAPRAVRAVDLMPGAPEIVRSAVIAVRSAAAPPQAGTPGPESNLAMWLPGDPPIEPDTGVAFELPSAAELVVRVHYKKTWQFERKEMHDRSTLGLYFATGATTPLQAVTVASSAAAPAGDTSGTRVFMTKLDHPVRALAIYPGEHLSGSGVVVTAKAPDGSQRQLIAFHPRAGWARRYWFTRPIALAGGTTIETRVTPDRAAAALPLLAPPAPGTQEDSSRVRLTLDVLPGR